MALSVFAADLNGQEYTDPFSHSILDIKKMLDAQFPKTDSLETVSRYIEMLKEAGLVEYQK